MVLVNSISKKRVPCRAILLDENLLLLERNNERTTRKSIKATVLFAFTIHRLATLRDDVIFFRVFVSELQVQG